MKIIDGKLISIDGNDIIDGVVKVEDGVTRIDDNAFGNFFITKILFPESVLYISPLFTNNFDKIESLTIPKYISTRNLEGILNNIGFNFRKIMNTYDDNAWDSLGTMIKKVKLSQELFKLCEENNLESSYIEKLPESLLSEKFILSGSIGVDFNSSIKMTVFVDENLITIELKYVFNSLIKRKIEIKTDNLSILENIYACFNENDYLRTIPTLEKYIAEAKEKIIKNILDEEWNNFISKSHECSISDYKKHYSKFKQLSQICDKLNLKELGEELLTIINNYIIIEFQIDDEQKKYKIVIDNIKETIFVVDNNETIYKQISFDDIEYLDIYDNKEIDKLLEIESLVLSKINEYLKNGTSMLDIGESHDTTYMIKDFYDGKVIYDKLKEALKYDSYYHFLELNESKLKILRTINDDTFRGIIGYLKLDILGIIKEYQYEYNGENIYIKDTENKTKIIVNDENVPISFYEHFDKQLDLLIELEEKIDNFLNRIKEVITNPTIKIAMRFKEHNIDPDIIDRYKPTIDEDFLLDNLILISNFGLLKYLDISNIEFPYIENLDLSYSNAKINLKNYKSIKNTDLTNIPLLFQNLDGIDATGANLRGTHVLVDVSKTITDEIIFDDTCIFWQGKRELSKDEARLLGLIVQNTDSKKIILKLPK